MILYIINNNMNLNLAIRYIIKISDYNKFYECIKR